jgi:hypothetical protein
VCLPRALLLLLSLLCCCRLLCVVCRVSCACGGCGSWDVLALAGVPGIFARCFHRAICPAGHHPRPGRWLVLARSSVAIAQTCRPSADLSFAKAPHICTNHTNQVSADNTDLILQSDQSGARDNSWLVTPGIRRLMRIVTSRLTGHNAR